MDVCVFLSLFLVSCLYYFPFYFCEWKVYQRAQREELHCCPEGGALLHWKSCIIALREVHCCTERVASLPWGNCTVALRELHCCPEGIALLPWGDCTVARRDSPAYSKRETGRPRSAVQPRWKTRQERERDNLLSLFFSFRFFVFYLKYSLFNPLSFYSSYSPSPSFTSLCSWIRDRSSFILKVIFCSVT